MGFKRQTTTSSTFAIASLVGGLVAGQDVPSFTDNWEENVNIGFDYCDKDGGGSVTYKEFAKCLKEFGSDDDVEKEFSKFDLDGIGKFNYEAAYLVNKRIYGPQPNGLGDENFDIYFNWIDDDGDGKLSWREFKSCWQPLFKGWTLQDLKDIFEFAD